MQKKIKRAVIWTILEGGAVYLAWIALVQNRAIAGSLLKVLIILSFIITLILTFNKEALKKIRKLGPSVPPAVNLVCGILYAFFLSYYSWFVYAALVLIGTILQVVWFYKED